MSFPSHKWKLSLSSVVFPESLCFFILKKLLNLSFKALISKIIQQDFVMSTLPCKEVIFLHSESHILIWVFALQK